jgi:hypothetical protein
MDFAACLLEISRTADAGALGVLGVLRKGH